MVRHYIELNNGAQDNTVKWAWNAAEGVYKGIEKLLGVTILSDTDTSTKAKGLVFGSHPKPARIRITYSIDKDNVGSCTRWCDPGNLEDCTNGGGLVGKKINIVNAAGTKSYKILSAAIKSN